MSKYDNIIKAPHHVSPSRAHMTNLNRAAQFAPFAALTGFEDEVNETARLTDSKIELDESEKERLNRSFIKICEKLPSQPQVTVTYFVPDEKKAGGKYITVDKRLKKTDNIYRKILFTDGTEISADDVLYIALTDHKGDNDEK